MFTLNINNYSDKDGLQTCNYEILDSSCNVINSETGEYTSSVKMYLESYFTQKVQIISGKGSIFNNTEIQFNIA